MFRMAFNRRGSAAGAGLVVLVLALIAGGIWFFVLRSTPEKTVTKLLEAARLGDDPMLRESLTERSSTDNNLVIGLSHRLAGEPTEEPRYTVGEAIVINNRATVPVSFPMGATFRTLTGMQTFTMPYVLHRDGQTWLVDTKDTQEELASQFTGGILETLRRFIMSDGGPKTVENGRRI